MRPFGQACMHSPIPDEISVEIGSGDAGKLLSAIFLSSPLSFPNEVTDLRLKGTNPISCSSRSLKPTYIYLICLVKAVEIIEWSILLHLATQVVRKKLPTFTGVVDWHFGTNSWARNRKELE